MTKLYDLIVIGGGTAGITAAGFATRLGVRVALIEKSRLGGDCTWTGCVPSKALLKVARVAHTIKAACNFGITSSKSPQVDMAQVQAYVQQAIADVYQHETPEILMGDGIEVFNGVAHFVDAHTVLVNDQTLRAKKFVITTGAHPFVPNVPGLKDVPYLTYLQLFDNDYLPERFIVMGAGPIGAEIAQAYQRLGSQVTLIDIGLLPREEPEAAEVMGRIFAREGIQFVEGLVTAAKQESDEIVLNVGEQQVRGDKLLVAVGRAPVVNGLELEKAGVTFSPKGIPVDKYLRTNVKHIYAAGDCIEGNYQFTHFAGWQAFKAVRNALLPFNEAGFTEVVPWTTFTDPEVAHVGLTKADARKKFGNSVRVARWNLDRVDRAVADSQVDGFIKVVHHKNGKVLGATIVAERAGEMITEYVYAVQHGLKMIDLANFIHVYPSYSMATMRLAAEVATESTLDGFTGAILTKLAGGN